MTITAHIRLTSPEKSGAKISSVAANIYQHLSQSALDWFSRQRTRAAFNNLTRFQLADIGAEKTLDQRPQKIAISQHRMINLMSLR